MAHGNHPNRHDDLRKALLLLHVQYSQASFLDDSLHDVQVTDDAAVHGVQSAALPCHVVLHDDDSIWPQALLRSLQELHQVLIRQVAWRQGHQNSFKSRAATTLVP